MGEKERGRLYCEGGSREREKLDNSILQEEITCTSHVGKGTNVNSLLWDSFKTQLFVRELKNICHIITKVKSSINYPYLKEKSYNK